MGRIRDYFSKWLERKIVDPLYEKFSARMDARIVEDEKRLETSVETHKVNAKAGLAVVVGSATADLTALVGSASAGLNIQVNDLKSNFGILSSQVDRHVKETDSKVDKFIEETTSKVGKAVQDVNSSVQTSADNVLTAAASYEDARTALEEMKTSFETVRAGLLDLQTQYKLDYAAFIAASKAVQDSIAGLEAKVSGWENKAAQLLSVDVTAERLDVAREGGERLLKSIEAKRDSIKEDVLNILREEYKNEIGSLVQSPEALRAVDSAVSFRLMRDEGLGKHLLMTAYCVFLPANRQSLVRALARNNGNYELMMKGLNDPAAVEWLEQFRKDVRAYGFDLNYMGVVIRNIQKNLKPC